MLKKIMMLAVASVMALTASAELRWGATAGMNVSSFHFNQDLITHSALPGAQAGVTGEMMFPGIGIGVDFGLRYQLMGSKVNLGTHEVWAADGFGNETVLVHTIQIPVNLRFKYTNLNSFERWIAPIVYAGPVFSVNAGHNCSGAFNFPLGNVALQCGIGAEILEHLQVTAGYYWAVTYQLQTIKLNNLSCRPQGWTVNLAWYF